MTETEAEKLALGQRLAEARVAAEMSQPAVATYLEEAGYTAKGKGTVSAWERGRNVPDALVLKQLALLYDTPADALLGLSVHSPMADRLAAAFDSLSGPMQAGFMEVCGPFLQKHATGAASDVFTNTAEETMTPEQRRAWEENRRTMTRSSSATIRKRSA